MKKITVLTAALLSLTGIAKAQAPYAGNIPETVEIDFSKFYHDEEFILANTDRNDYLLTPCTVTSAPVEVTFTGEPNAWRVMPNGFYAYKGNAPVFTVSVKEGYVTGIEFTVTDGLEFTVGGYGESVSQWTGTEKSVTFDGRGGVNGYLKNLKVTYTLQGGETGETGLLGLQIKRGTENFDLTSVPSFEYSEEGISTDLVIAPLFSNLEESGGFDMLNDLDIILEKADGVDFAESASATGGWNDYVYSGNSKGIVSPNGNGTYGVAFTAGCSGLYTVTFRSLNPRFELDGNYEFDVNIYSSIGGMKLVDGEYEYDVEKAQREEGYTYTFLYPGESSAELVENRIAPRVVLPVYGVEIQYKVLTDGVPSDFIQAVDDRIDLSAIYESSEPAARISFLLVKNGAATPMASGREGETVQTVVIRKTMLPTGSVTLSEEDGVSPVYYNLQGIEVSNPEKGLYIKVNGRHTEKEVL